MDAREAACLGAVPGRVCLYGYTGLLQPGQKPVQVLDAEVDHPLLTVRPIIGSAGEGREHRWASRLSPGLIAHHGHSKMVFIPLKQRVRIFGAKEHATNAG